MPITPLPTGPITTFIVSQASFKTPSIRSPFGMPQHVHHLLRLLSLNFVQQDQIDRQSLDDLLPDAGTLNLEEIQSVGETINERIDRGQQVQEKDSEAASKNEEQSVFDNLEAAPSTVPTHATPPTQSEDLPHMTAITPRPRGLQWKICSGEGDRVEGGGDEVGGGEEEVGGEREEGTAECCGHDDGKGSLKLFYSSFRSCSCISL